MSLSWFGAGEDPGSNFSRMFVALYFNTLALIICLPPTLADVAPFRWRQIGTALVPDVFCSPLPTAERSSGGRPSVEHVPRIACVVAFCFEAVQLSVGDNCPGVIESRGAHSGA